MDLNERATAALRERTQTWDAEHVARGHACGREWARERAACVELGRIAERAAFLHLLATREPINLRHGIADAVLAEDATWGQRRICSNLYANGQQIDEGPLRRRLWVSRHR